MGRSGSSIVACIRHSLPLFLSVMLRPMLVMGSARLHLMCMLMMVMLLNRIVFSTRSPRVVSMVPSLSIRRGGDYPLMGRRDQCRLTGTSTDSNDGGWRSL